MKVISKEKRDFRKVKLTSKKKSEFRKVKLISKEKTEFQNVKLISKKMKVSKCAINFEKNQTIFDKQN